MSGTKNESGPELAAARHAPSSGAVRTIRVMRAGSPM